MSRAAIASVLVLIVTGCTSAPQATYIIRPTTAPTVQQAEAATDRLKLGMTEQEALRVLAFPDDPFGEWTTISMAGYAGKHYEIDLGSERPAESSLCMTFVFSQEDELMHLDSWQIRRDACKKVDTEPGAQGDAVNRAP